MTSSELKQFVDVRFGELSQDEIMQVLNVSNNKSIDHIEYIGENYSVWCNDGTFLHFKLRKWR